MAIFHLVISNISRDKGRSSVATAAYMEGRNMKDQRFGKTYRYRRQKEQFVVTGVVLPAGAPDRYKDSEILFNEVELYEKAVNARTAKYILAALPREFDAPTNKKVVEEYCRINFASKGHCASYAIHSNDDNHNPFVQIMAVNRPLDSNGKWTTKYRREYVLDENGERIPIIDPATGKQKLGQRNRKQWKRVNVEVNSLDYIDTFRTLRKTWADVCNQYLDVDNQIDHRSYEERGIDQIPTVHEGPIARWIEAKGDISEKCQRNRDIREANQQISELNKQMKEIDEQQQEIQKQLDELEKQKEALLRAKSESVNGGIT